MATASLSSMSLLLAELSDMKLKLYGYIVIIVVIKTLFSVNKMLGRRYRQWEGWGKTEGTAAGKLRNKLLVGLEGGLLI